MSVSVPVQPAPAAQPSRPRFRLDTEYWGTSGSHSWFCSGGAYCTYLSLLTIGIFLLVVLLPLSFDYVEYYEVGFKRSVYGTTDTSTVLNRGRHYIRPGLDKLVTFDATYQQVAFLTSNGQSLSVYGQNGVQFSIDCVFYYKIAIDTLAKTYSQFNLGYPTQVANEAATIIKDAAPMFGLLDYSANRVAVQQTLGSILQTSLSQQVYVDANSTYFVILDVTYPATTLTANLDSALAIQQAAVAASTQSLQLILQETSVLVEQVIVQANITTAKAQADANVIVQNSISHSTAVVQSANGVGIQYAASALGFSVADGSFNEFVQLVAMQQATSPHVVLGVEQSVYTLNLS